MNDSIEQQNSSIAAIGSDSEHNRSLAHASAQADNERQLDEKSLELSQTAKVIRKFELGAEDLAKEEAEARRKQGSGQGSEEAETTEDSSNKALFEAFDADYEASKQQVLSLAANFYDVYFSKPEYREELNSLFSSPDYYQELVASYPGEVSQDQLQAIQRIQDHYVAPQRGPGVNPGIAKGKFLSQVSEMLIPSQAAMLTEQGRAQAQQFAQDPLHATLEAGHSVTIGNHLKPTFDKAGLSQEERGETIAFLLNSPRFQNELSRVQSELMDMEQASDSNLLDGTTTSMYPLSTSLFGMFPPLRSESGKDQQVEENVIRPITPTPMNW